jgi:putative transposase
MGLSRQAHYQAIRTDKQRCQHSLQVVEVVKAQRMHHPRLGTRKLHHLLGGSLQERGIKLGRDALFDLLRGAGMLIKPAKAYHKTTQSHHRFRRHPNLLKDVALHQVAAQAEQVWVADITYLPTDGACAYISLITDVHSRKIVGHHVHDSLHTEHVAQALKMALASRQTCQKLIHHSDRGIQYCSDQYQQLHQRHGITCSMTDGYDCYQNALAERINGILKNEYLLHRPANLQEARKMVAQSIYLYNHERPHTALKYKTPDEIHRASIASQLAHLCNRQTVNL